MNKIAYKSVLSGGVFLMAIVVGLYVNAFIPKQWVEQIYHYDVFENKQGQPSYIFKGQAQIIDQITPYADSVLTQEHLNNLTEKPAIASQWVELDNGDIAQLKPVFHFGFWSLMPAVITISLCLLTREPLSALFSGIVTGAFSLGLFDITDGVIIPYLANQSSVGLLILYLWLLGGLLGVWSKTGAAQAFANLMTRHCVKGPRSAKVITWLLGVLFFQGGTMSTVLVGTTVKPFADKANVSHEEMSYIVDSTASPIAAVLAFNAWPAYVQALIFVPGVAFLATESQRIAFFFASIPFSFYGLLAVFGTLLLSFNITRFSGKRIRMAQQRALKTGKLDADGATPLSARELHSTDVPPGYRPHAMEFLFPLITLIGIAVGTFVVSGSPEVNWAFSAALLISIGVALGKGMMLVDVVDGLGNGLKGVVLASVILMLAVVLGTLSKELGGGLYLVNLLGESIEYWMLPLLLLLLSMVIAFSTGTSWGTYAIAFPLAMPLAWSVGHVHGLQNIELYMMICFATVLNGSIFGDQCSPISDTTILSAMTTGCDLMDHVKSQIVPATFAMSAAAVLWTASVILFT
ncbi:Na+/H+ antiporter NhaC family protein [Pseudoalteromonas sp. MMG005]|uniref:Na+/H+ antiporter NhaC family protein n=1 Tax=Pseudoalteromonas sp. MMG005 TaxID=2822682 RepID=UPI001B3A0F73|nr:Na+/H+ antiporter NhaC family protein [Pseudoalteromonas sp. MMG005]MBQ4846025.1 sodium:proton antiporter [Pseudoalteromonas sp. MMG005]